MIGAQTSPTVLFHPQIRGEAVAYHRPDFELTIACSVSDVAHVPH
jgi:hypothetical protein